MIEEIISVPAYAFEYAVDLTPQQLLGHAAVILIGSIIFYMICYKFHAKIMLDHGITWTWLLAGIYLVVIAAGVIGVFYNWLAPADVNQPSPMSRVLIGFYLPVVAGLVLLESAGHARRSIKITREHQRGNDPRV